MTHGDSDFLVIGGGIAGASIAAHLAERHHVCVLEMEDQPGYHSTGRSAALFSEAYGNPTIRALSRASRSFFFDPPAAFSATPLVTTRSVLVIGRVEQRAVYERFIAEEALASGVRVLDAAEAVAVCPVLRPEGLIGALLDHRTADIDVSALHQGYLRLLKQRDGRVVLGAKVSSLRRDGETWVVETSKGSFGAKTVVNAAGAWAGEIGCMANATDIGIEPRRRTVALIEPPAGMDPQAWPMLLDVEERFYLKPDAGLLLLSPADETPDVPGDAQPEEIDIAIAADRLGIATAIEVRRIRSKWAGLRSFVSDRSPVVGYDPIQKGFFWSAALGGYGIQTAPALSALAARLAAGLPSEAAFAKAGLHAADISPRRLTGEA